MVWCTWQAGTSSWHPPDLLPATAVCFSVRLLLLLLQGRGGTCVLVAVQQVLVGVVAVMDPIKPEARWVAMHSACGVSVGSTCCFAAAQSH